MAQKNSYSQLDVCPELNPPHLVGTNQFEKNAGNFQTFAVCSLKIYNEFLPRLLRRSLSPNLQQNMNPEYIIDRVKDTLISMFKKFPEYEGNSSTSKQKPIASVFFFKGIEVMSYLVQPLGMLP